MAAALSICMVSAMMMLDVEASAVRPDSHIYMQRSAEISSESLPALRARQSEERSAAI
jgi:hypothetical protein